MPIYEEVGNQYAESTTQDNLAMVYPIRDRLAEAVAQLSQGVIGASDVGVENGRYPIGY